ncbi:Uncharacterized protein BM_BM8546 [Brugia malayi]|uniref:Bm8546 n=1 Tax=Brugia malayi TaxID=6279 RepID=A0A4E9ES00_BRUMA|nr:Uncharacterized protein BM_BM8546 [Brugia malayi]VIO86076.1 Uncharacterized protein BM_BM8546 [Brugia malayi]
MSAKQQTGNVAAPVDNGEVVRIMDDDARIVRPKPRASNATKKNRINNNNSNNTGVPLVSNVEDTPPNVVFDQPNRPHVQQPYMAHSCRPNMTHPVVIGSVNRPMYMPVHNPPPSTCWCNGISDDIRAIKETLNSVSNGIHLIHQKVEMHQINNAQMMSQIWRNVQMVADNVSFAQMQGYGEYYDGSGVGNPIGIPDGTAPPETCYEQTNEQNMPIEHIMNNSSRSYP